MIGIKFCTGEDIRRMSHSISLDMYTSWYCQHKTFEIVVTSFCSSPTKVQARPLSPNFTSWSFISDERAHDDDYARTFICRQFSYWWHLRLQQVEQVKKHCKTQRLPCSGWKRYKNIYSSYKIENHLLLVVGDGKLKWSFRRDAVRHLSNIFSGSELDPNCGTSIIQKRKFTPWDSFPILGFLSVNCNHTFTYEVHASFSVDTWPSSDLIGQNYLGWRAKESAQRYQGHNAKLQC